MICDIYIVGDFILGKLQVTVKNFFVAVGLVAGAMFLPLCFLFLISCGGGSGSNNESSELNDTTLFSDSVVVTIVDYEGDAMEPFISRDGQTLFFNNLNSATLLNGDVNDTNLHYATRIDYDRFQYMGELAGANIDELDGSGASMNELEGVATMDLDGKFYFIRTIDYLNESSPDYLRSMFRADYADGELTNIESLPNLRHGRDSSLALPGELNFDVEIDAAGEFLYFVQGTFSGSSAPDSADIGVAVINGGMVEIVENSAELFSAINTSALEYAVSISTDGLEIFFSRGIETGGEYDFGIYRATRSSLSSVWQNVEQLSNIDGDLVEAPSISFDGSSLYFHQRIAGFFTVYVSLRN